MKQSPGLRIGILNYKEDLFGIFTKSFERQGHHVETLQMDKVNFEGCVNWLKARPFDFVLLANSWFYTHEFKAQLEEYLADQKIPCAVWHWEKVFFSGPGYFRKRLDRAPFPKNFLFFVTDKADVSILKKYGIEAKYLPLAVDEDLRSFTPAVEQKSSFGHNLSFSGMPFELQGVNATDEKNLIFGFTSNTILEFYNKVFNHINPGHKLAPPTRELNSRLLQSLFDFYSGLYPNFAAMKVGWERLFGEWSTMLAPEIVRYVDLDYFYRISYIYSYLQLSIYLNRLQKFDIRIYGSPDWAKLIPHYRHPIRRLSETEFYTLLSASKITFCLTKLQFENFVHERPMMTLACGGFPITDFREAVPELLEPDECVTYRSFEEAEELISYYLAHDSERNRIMEKGRARVRACHTYANRVETLIKDVREYFGL